MRAVVINRYGGPEVLQLRDVAPPRLNAGEILIRVRAAGINPVDWKIRSGQVWPIVRLSFPHILGEEVAGEVEQVGQGVSRFREGDAVYAMTPVGQGGGYAERIALPAAIVAHKPAGRSSEEAAGIPLAGMTALQALRDKGGLQPGQSVLVNGAAGGVGTFAVQIAKALGGSVTGVCSGSSSDFVRGLGAGAVIDYRNEDFTRGPARYDIVLDAVANRSFAACARVLSPRGRYVTTLPSAGIFFWSAVLPVAGLAGYRKRARFLLVRPSSRDLEFLRGLAGEGKLKSVIDRVYPLEEASAAHQHSEAGHVHGKIVLRVE